jgi:hypothetical protein
VAELKVLLSIVVLSVNRPSIYSPEATIKYQVVTVTSQSGMGQELKED